MFVFIILLTESFLLGIILYFFESAHVNFIVNLRIIALFLSVFPIHAIYSGQFTESLTRGVIAVMKLYIFSRIQFHIDWPLL